MPMPTAELYQHDQFLARKQIFKLLGAAFHLRTMDGKLLAYSKQKAFKLKEDIRVYEDEEQTVELLTIQADRVIDFAASYSVIDSRTGEKVGSLRRKGWSSLIRDTWEILDPSGQARGRVLEESQWKALLRRYVELTTLFLPQTYLIEYDGKPVGRMTQNLFGIPPKFTVDLSADADRSMPRPLAVATVILLLAVEGRQ
jgi:hypothetical protein